ncbi:MAG TPA: hypothetical protein VI968_03505 [archaeon]|nr:hypothetical protein [archaeon]
MKVSVMSYIIVIFAAIIAVFLLTFVQINAFNAAGSASCNDNPKIITETHDNADGTVTVIETNVCNMCTTISDYSGNGDLIDSTTNCK